jgi:hypothetical protein
MKWALLAATGVILILLFVFLNTEHFTDTEFTNVTQPCLCATPLEMDKHTESTACDPKCLAWSSKVTALAPTNAVVADYISVLQAFYSDVYVPAPTKPTEAQVDSFLASSAGTVAGVDSPSLKRIIMDGFHIESSLTAAQKEEKSQNFKPSDVNLTPDMGRDEVRTREEGGYTGANPNPSIRFSEGEYAPVKQTKPLNPGQWEDGSTMWKGPRPASVCPCAENIM